MKMIHLEGEVVEFAKNRMDSRTYRDSITNQEGKWAGALGEAMVWKWFKNNNLAIHSADSSDYDLVTPGGRRVEVKTVRTTQEVVLPHYCAEVEDRYDRPDHEIVTLQDCDVYVFCRVNTHKMLGAVMGWDTPYGVTTRWRYQKKGDVWEGWTAPASCVVQQYGNLNRMHDLEGYLRNLDPRAPRMKYSLHGMPSM